ncbi:LPXTG cell wall anchor domain-containing protein [Enterococcus hirae]|nr:LPXTG cell wall anchor domain-containing protein [Enterococcus hirae]MCH1976538.1 LPXTG cell wall anchor domain-containing protein [Enterococcus hirae]
MKKIPPFSFFFTLFLLGTFGFTTLTSYGDQVTTGHFTVLDSTTDETSSSTSTTSSSTTASSTSSTQTDTTTSFTGTPSTETSVTEERGQTNTQTSIKKEKNATEASTTPMASPEKKLPTTGEMTNFLFLLGIIDLIIFSGLLYWILKKRKEKDEKE